MEIVQTTHVLPPRGFRGIEVADTITAAAIGGVIAYWITKKPTWGAGVAVAAFFLFNSKAAAAIPGAPTVNAAPPPPLPLPPPPSNGGGGGGGGTGRPTPRGPVAPDAVIQPERAPARRGVVIPLRKNMVRATPEGVRAAPQEAPAVERVERAPAPGRKSMGNQSSLTPSPPTNVEEEVYVEDVVDDEPDFLQDLDSDEGEAW